MRRHDGVITLAQARGSGLSHSAIQRRVLSGRWRRCAAGIYFADDRPFTTAARIRAAVWAHGASATATGLTAAWWLGLVAVEPGEREVTVPRNSHGRSRPGVSVRRRDLQEQVAIEIDGWAFRSDQPAFQNDRKRQNWLALHGWQVLRFTWLDITQHPERVLAEIRAAIRRANRR